VIVTGKVSAATTGPEIRSQRVVKMDPIFSTSGGIFSRIGPIFSQMGAA
jgi:hypothetical protein